jgi:hypothetical protein
MTTTKRATYASLGALALSVVGGAASCQKKPEAPAYLTIGEHGRVDVASDKVVPCFATEDAFDAGVKAATAKDEIGWKEALARSWYIDKGTEVLVIGEGRPLSTAKEVRVLGGEYKGKACWMMRARMARLTPAEAR